MQVLHSCCCGLDVHKRFVVACLITYSDDGKQHKELRRFDTVTPELLRLVDWLQQAGCTHVALESTGVYWKPIFNLMEGLFELVLVNAQHMKAVPGRKTDSKDAEWIADLLQHGLLKASFIPPQTQRDLRDLTRYRTSLKQERTCHVNRIHKLREETNIKLSSVFADLMCKTGRAILAALAEGEERPEVLADLALLGAPHKRQALVPALQGCMRPHHRFLLRELLGMIDSLKRAIGRLDHEIEERLRPQGQSLCQNHAGAGGPGGGQDEDLSGSAVPAPVEGAGHEARRGGGRPQHPGDLLPHAHDFTTLSGERRGLLRSIRS